MATELAKAYVQIIPSADGIQGRLAKTMGGESVNAGMSSGNSFAGAFKKAIASAGIGLALKKIVGDAFAEGGELQQNLGGTEAVFGQFANTIQTQATSAYKNMGMSASEYMATANKMGSLFQGSGLEQQRALDLTSQAMQRAADVASVMGLDTASAMESIAGAAKGNFTMMDNLGVAMNATTLEAYALEKGMNFDWKTASNAEKAELAMKMFMDRTSQYAGNFARESEETWSGSIGAMKSAYKDLMANIMLGNNLGPSLTAMGETIKNFVVNNLIPAVMNIIRGLPMALGALVIEFVPQIINAGNQLITQIITWLQNQFPIFLQQGVEIINNVVNGILGNLPTLIATAGNAITSFIGGILSTLPSVLQAGGTLLLNLVDGVVKNLPSIISAAGIAIGKFILVVGQNLPKILQTGIEILGKMASGLIKAIPDLVSKIPQIIDSIKREFLSVDWWDIGKNIINGIANGLANAGHMLWDAVKDVLGNFKDKVLDFFGIHSPSRWGEYVGKMISLGFPRGVENNLNPFRNAMDKLGAVASEPLENTIVKRSNLTVEKENSNTGIADKLDRLIEILLLILDESDDKEIKLYLKDREVARALREMGVVFE
nr:MAG TPA: tail tape measure protein [Caudoviricetes sp.]